MSDQEKHGNVRYVGRAVINNAIYEVSVIAPVSEWKSDVIRAVESTGARNVRLELAPPPKLKRLAGILEIPKDVDYLVEVTAKPTITEGAKATETKTILVFRDGREFGILVDPKDVKPIEKPKENDSGKKKSEELPYAPITSLPANPYGPLDNWGYFFKFPTDPSVNDDLYGFVSRETIRKITEIIRKALADPETARIAKDKGLQGTGEFQEFGSKMKLTLTIYCPTCSTPQSLTGQSDQKCKKCDQLIAIIPVKQKKITR